MVDVGRYQWIVLMAAFSTHALLGMVLDSLGALHVIFLKAFNGGSGDTALATSLLSCTFYGIAPVTGIMVVNLPCWLVGLAGGLLGGLGLVLSAYMCSLPTLYLTFGVLAGVGMGMVYMPTITCTGQVFDKHRALAFGIASSGVGVGKFLGPLLISATEEQFGWRGAMLLLGGITFNLCVCAVIYYRPSRAMRKIPKPCDSDVDITPTTNEKEAPGVLNGKGTSVKSIHLIGGLNNKDRFGYSDSNYSLDRASEVSPTKGSDQKILPVVQNSCPASCPASYRDSELLESLRRELVTEGDLTSLAAAMSTSSLFLSATDGLSAEHLSSRILYRSSKLNGSTRSHLFATPTRQSAQVSIQDLAVSGDVHSVCKTPSHLSLPLPADDQILAGPGDTVKPRRRRAFQLNFFLMRDPDFVILCLNNLLFSMGYALAHVHLPAFSIEKGQSAYSGNLLVSAIGIASLVGKISLGWVSQLSFLSPMSVYTVTSIMAAVATALVPTCDTFGQFLTYAIFFGYISGSFGAVLPSLVVSIATVDLLPSAYGFLLVFEAIGFLLGPSIGGWLYDATGLYAASFLFGGAVMLVASLMMIYSWVHQCRNEAPPLPPDIEEVPKQV